MVSDSDAMLLDEVSRAGSALSAVGVSDPRLIEQLASATDGLGLFTGLLLGGLFVVTAELHLAENALALHLLLERLESLVDIVIANENLHAASSFSEPEWDRVKARGRQKDLAPDLERAD